MIIAHAAFVSYRCEYTLLVLSSDLAGAHQASPLAQF